MISHTKNLMKSTETLILMMMARAIAYLWSQKVYLLDLKKASANHLISVGFRSLSKPANGEELNDSETDKEPSASTTTKRALSEPQTETFLSSNIFRQGNLKSPRE